MPKHLFTGRSKGCMKVDGCSVGIVSEFLCCGRCFRKDLTAPSTPSSDSIAFASSTARSFTCRQIKRNTNCNFLEISPVILELLCIVTNATSHKWMSCPSQYSINEGAFDYFLNPSLNYLLLQEECIG